MLALFEPRNSIVEGGCGGPGRDIWIFGPIGALLVFLTRRWRRSGSRPA